MGGRSTQQQGAPSGRPFPIVPWWPVPAIVIAVLVAYLPALGGGFIWDDDLYVTENLTLRSVQGLQDIWLTLGATPQYYPFVHSSFWIEYRLWGDHPLGYHATNVLLHATAALLLGVLLRRLRIPGAWLAAAVFALHPVHVESVAWVTERKNVLSAVFYLAALLAYVRFAGLDGAEAPRERRWGFYAAALLLFVGALLSKTVTATLPAAILLLLWWKRKRLAPGDLWPLLPMFAIGVGFGLVTVWMEKAVVGASGGEWSLTLVERGLVAGRIPWFYAGKLLWPFPLIFIYPRWVIDAAALGQWLFPLAAAAAVLLLWRFRGRLGKGPLVAALFFIGTLFPALGFIDVYPMRFSFVADHFQYLASLGPIALAAALFARLSAGAGRVRVVAPVVLLAGLGLLTWRQAGVYHDLETLWRDTLAKNPTAWMAHNNLGNLLKARGDLDEAQRAYTEALRHYPDFSDAHNNLGTMLADRGRHAEAIVHYERAIEIGPPRALFYLNLGNSLVGAGRFDEAMGRFLEALERKPGWPPAWNGLGRALTRLGRLDEAIEVYGRTLAVLPQDADAHIGLGVVYGVQQRMDEAIAQFDRVLQIDPKNPEALGALGIAMSVTGRSEEAITVWHRALAGQPGNANVGLLLGAELLKVGRAEEAIAVYAQVLRFEPGHEQALRGLNTARSAIR